MTSEDGAPADESGVQGSHPGTRAILDRRSVREGFTGQQVPREVIEEIVACGLAAPSSKNAQPWRLHVVADPRVRSDIAAAAVAAEGADAYAPRDPTTGVPWPDWTSTVELSAGVLRECSVAIFVENLGVFSRGRGTLATVPRSHLVGSLVGYTFEVMGIGMAVENMWIAATVLGLWGSYLGDIVIVEEMIGKQLNLEGDLVGVLALGYTHAGPEWVKEIDVGGSSRVVWH